MSNKKTDDLFRPKNMEEINERILKDPPSEDYETLAKDQHKLQEELNTLGKFCEEFAGKDREKALKNYPMITKLIKKLDIMEAIDLQPSPVLKIALRRYILSIVLSSVTSFNFFMERKTKTRVAKVSFVPLYASLYKKYNDPKFKFGLSLEKDFINVEPKILNESLVIRLLGADEEEFEQIIEEYCKFFLFKGVQLTKLQEEYPKMDIYPKPIFLMNLFSICLPKAVRERKESVMDLD